MDERIAALTAQIEKLQAENTFLKHSWTRRVFSMHCLPQSPWQKLQSSWPADSIPISGAGRMFTANAV